ncbi:MAG: hypothetical protein AAFO94_20000, partial [Bacteroidota bacterium]
DWDKVGLFDPQKAIQRKSNTMRTKDFLRGFWSLMLSACLLPTLSGSCIFSKPIEALDLDIGNMISWSTSEEISNQFFIVQKSVDGTEYETIGQVQGAGDSSEEQHYRFLDIAVGNKRTFYRIKHIEFAGTSSHTHTVLVNRAKQNNFVITAMSRTSTDRFFTVTMRSSVEAFAKYELLDKSGRVMKEGRAGVVSGSNMISMDLNKLPLGRYRFLLTIDEEREELYIRKVDPSQVPAISYVVRE